MKRRLKHTIENGKLVWRITDEEVKVISQCVPCEKMKKAREKAQVVHDDLKRVRDLKLDLTGGLSRDIPNP